MCRQKKCYSYRNGPETKNPRVWYGYQPGIAHNDSRAICDRAANVRLQGAWAASTVPVPISRSRHQQKLQIYRTWEPWPVSLLHKLTTSCGRMWGSSLRPGVETTVPTPTLSLWFHRSRPTRTLPAMCTSGSWTQIAKNFPIFVFHHSTGLSTTRRLSRTPPWYLNKSNSTVRFKSQVVNNQQEKVVDTLVSIIGRNCNCRHMERAELILSPQ